MDLKAIVKFFFDSKIPLAALFATGLALFLGPRHLPSLVPKVPEPWGFVPVGVLVLSGVPLLVALVGWVGGALGAIKRRLFRLGFSYVDLTPPEKQLLRAMAALPGYQVSLERVVPDWRIEVDECLNGLAKRGLVERVGFASELAQLTSVGKRQAIKLRSEARENHVSIEEDAIHLFR